MRTLCASEFAFVSGGTGEPGDGVWQPDDYAYYNQQASAWGTAALAWGSAAGLAGLVALGLAIPTAGVGSLVAGGVSGTAGLTALVAQERAAQFERMALLEALDRMGPAASAPSDQAQVDPQ